MPTTEVRGLSNLRYRLRRFEFDFVKEMKNEMEIALTPIVRKARGFIPADPHPSHWKQTKGGGKWPVYDINLMRKGIDYSDKPSKKNRRGFQYYSYIYNATASGAIFETAGRKNPHGQPRSDRPKGVKETRKRFNRSNNPEAGKYFIAGLEKASPLTQANFRKGKGRRGRYKKGRLIFRAWAEDQGRAYGAVIKAIEKANSRFNKRRVF